MQKAKAFLSIWAGKHFCKEEKKEESALNSYQEAKEYVEQIGKTGSILGLTRICHLMKELGDVQEKLQIVHIAGTNGKGSTGAFLSFALQELGFSTGRYISPAVNSPLEVWQINGASMTEQEYVRYVEKVKKACDAIVQTGMEHPTAFEFETAMAFCYFAEKNCDYVLLEVGMGGREDATNLIKKPLCSVITSISMDHMQFFGNSLERIAKEKAGIIKDNCPVVTISQPPEVMQVISEEAKQRKAPLIVAEDKNADMIRQTADKIQFRYKEFGEVEIQLAGSCQVKNAVLAVETIKLLLQLLEKQKRNASLQFCSEVQYEQIRNGLKKTRWQGRFECICKHPLIYIDGAHNEEAALFLKNTVEKCFTNKRIIYIIGVLADKEHEKMLKIMLPLAESVYTVTPQNARALKTEKLAEEALKYHKRVQAEKTILAAVKDAVNEWDKDAVIIAFGSLSYLKDVRDAVYRSTQRKKAYKKQADRRKKREKEGKHNENWQSGI